ncbi:MAG: hypothetical protein JWO41_344 [Candidatus Saccharibacteria bacterium]|nr:hypothetical protein [Candidatus Saccharibacteria bacterium]
MFPVFLKSKLTQLLVIIYLGLVAWWVEINAHHLTTSKQNMYFGFTYALVALLGGLNGLRVSRGWGGFKSVLGRGLSFFSLGLLCLGIGQLIFSYYNIVAQVEIPFPSAADYFYFSIIILYILGSVTLFQSSGSRYSLGTIKGRIVAFIIPALALAASWVLLLKNLQLDFSSLHNGLVTFLSYSSPLGGAIYISIAILTFQLSYRTLGGVLRKRILFLVAALILEYSAEYLFAYRAAKGVYFNGDVDDLIFATSVVAMCLALNAFALQKKQTQDSTADKVAPALEVRG